MFFNSIQLLNVKLFDSIKKINYQNTNGVNNIYESSIDDYIGTISTFSLENHREL